MAAPVNSQNALVKDAAVPGGPVALRAMALQIAGPERPQQARVVHLDTAFLIAPDGSTNSPRQMLHAFVRRVLPGAAFLAGTTYRIPLAVEGGLYRLDQSIFPGRFELFGVVMLAEGLAPPGSVPPPPDELVATKTALDASDGLVVAFAADALGPTLDGGTS